MTYTASMKICMRCFPDLFVSEGEIFISLTGTGPVKHQCGSSNWWDYVLKSPSMNAWLKVRGDMHVPWSSWEWLSALIHNHVLALLLTALRLWQDPVIGGWPGVVYECVVSPHNYERACSYITKVAGTTIVLLSWWNSKHEMDRMYHRNLS